MAVQLRSRGGSRGAIGHLGKQRTCVLSPLQLAAGDARVTRKGCASKGGVSVSQLPRGPGERRRAGSQGSGAARLRNLTPAARSAVCPTDYMLRTPVLH